MRKRLCAHGISDILLAMSTVGGITDFLSELGETESLSVLREAYSRQSPLIFKLETTEQPVRARIGAFIDKRVVILPEPGDMTLPLDKEISIKFNVGTEIYFIKTTFKAHLNKFYVDMGTKVIQLKRRKEPRFNIPKTWNQSAYVIVSANSAEQIKCSVFDISNSGVRFEIAHQVQVKFQRDDILNIRFQVHKRSEVSTMAIVRFVLNRPNANTLLGMEFANISDVQGQRVASIVSDIQMHNSTIRT